MTIGERLRMLRQQHNMTLDDVGKHLNVTRATVQRYESGNITNIPSDKLEILSYLFGVSPSYLIGWNETQNEKQVPGDPKNKNIRLLISGLHKLSPEQVEQATDMFRIMFEKTNPDLFKDEGSDES